ncbi:MAG: threonine--tRNA ligase [Spirochaetes bacterium]|nr:threonine--tRNA ligase [Spirochaetota bacterium]
MNDKITITLPDKRKIEVEKGTTLYDITGQIGKSLQKAALAAEVNGILCDLSTSVEADSGINIITFDSDKGKSLYWHSTSHLMAQAVKRLYPDAKFAIGPSIENGFYYDIDMEKSLSPEDLTAIEAEMEKIVEEKLDIKREDMSRSEAIDYFKKTGEIYKVELLNEFPDDRVSLYRQGEFADLCRGPHVINTDKLKAFKLLSIAGAYWRGDEKNKMLQRIYGISFTDKKELTKHLEFLEEVKKRDHRKLGKELDLFSSHEDVGGGLIHWHPKGSRLRVNIEDWWRKEHYKNGYEILYTPHIGRAHLWETSGHLGFYKDSMYSPMDIEGSEYFIKPMNCPFHIKIYQNSLRSYRDLPLRFAELGTVYRYEKSGVLHGLLRVRGFTQDDAHIFCTPAQIDDEVREVLRFSLWIWKTLGFTDIKAYLATKPEKSVGDPDRWITAQESLRKAIESENLQVELDEGGGAFYGPKIDLKIRDAIGREWQMTTIQFDFNMSERFEMTFVGEDGQKHRPYMVHRALLGSMERFIGILIEHYAGKFPAWFAPVHAILISVSDEQSAAVLKVKSEMIDMGFRPETDLRNESVGYKIREAVLQKVPYICVFGKNEVENRTVSVRKRGENNSVTMSLNEFYKILNDDIVNKIP